MSDSAEDVLTSEQGAGPAVSARVAKLAQDIYDEFQNIIGEFSPFSVVLRLLSVAHTIGIRVHCTTLCGVVQGVYIAACQLVHPLWALSVWPYTVKKVVVSGHGHQWWFSGTSSGFKQPL